MEMDTVKYIDLFAGIGGFRLGFSNACNELGIKHKCVFTSEIKPYAITVYKSNFKGKIFGDITKIKASDIPDFDVLLAGFPCQAFSSAGKRQGFLETRGTLFFEVARILKEKSPRAFILENVEGLIKHDLKNKSDPIGQTLSTILCVLNSLGYKVSWRLLDSSDFGVAQRRKRIFIVGFKDEEICLSDFVSIKHTIADILEAGKELLDNNTAKLLLAHFPIDYLYGKCLKDKRGGKENIHSWDIELKGSVTKKQKKLLEWLLKARRRKDWALKKGITWMDGMPLTLSEIQESYGEENLKHSLDDLVEKGYLKYEHPKDVCVKKNALGHLVKSREYRTDLEKGYNIVAGKLSFDINKILNPHDISPTLVATDLDRVVVPDCNGIRRLTKTEQLRLFGFPDDFKMPVKDREAFDLFGNTVAVPVVEAVSKRVLNAMNGTPFIPLKKEKNVSISQMELGL